MTRTLKVTGMSCKHCSGRVEAALSGVPGVASAKVDLAAGTARVECDESVSVASLADAVSEAGYEVVG